MLMSKSCAIFSSSFPKDDTASYCLLKTELSFHIANVIPFIFYDGYIQWSKFYLCEARRVDYAKQLKAIANESVRYKQQLCY